MSCLDGVLRKKSYLNMKDVKVVRQRNDVLI